MESAFDAYVEEYDRWYDDHPAVYQSEILAVSQAIPAGKKGLEVGAGTGRFSVPFNITTGVEPSANMAKLAGERGITVINAVAENLPFHTESFDFVLMVTADCFLSDIPKAFSEVKRVLKKSGFIIIGMIDKNSELGKKYDEAKSTDKFYARAHFHSTDELTGFLKQAGFSRFSYWQTLSQAVTGKAEEPREGYGLGSFVVIKAEKE